MSSMMSADAPPPPLHTPATPYFPCLCLRTCQKIWAEVNSSLKMLVNIWHTESSSEIKPWHNTPKRVTKIRAPLQPRGCPNDTAPPWTLTFSYNKKERGKILSTDIRIIRNQLNKKQDKEKVSASYRHDWLQKDAKLTGWSPSNFWLARATTCTRKKE